MCGIVAVAGVIDSAESALFRMMLELDTVRGRDSTGFATVPTTADDVKTFKSTADGYNFVKSKGFNELMKQPSCLLLGHNRAATQGSVTTANAHPFNHGKIVGVHNGSLDMGYERHLKAGLKSEDQKKFEVDSELIFYTMSKIGVEETLKRTHGGFALVWYNSEEDTLNFIRNEGRPLAFGVSRDGKNLFLSSDARIFYMANEYSRARVRLENEQNYMHMIPPNVLFSFDMPLKKTDRFDTTEPWSERKEVSVATIRSALPVSKANGWGHDDRAYGYTPTLPYYGPRATATVTTIPTVSVLSEQDRVNKKWEEYAVTRSKRRLNEDHIEHIKREAQRLVKEDDPSRYLYRYNAANTISLSIWNKTGEDSLLSLGQADKIIGLEIEKDFCVDVLVAYSELASPAKIEELHKLIDQMSSKALKLEFQKETEARKPKSPSPEPEKPKQPLSRKQRKQRRREKAASFQARNAKPSDNDLLDMPCGCGDLTSLQFLSRVKGGCSVCMTKKIQLEDAHLCGVTNNNEIICKECLESDFVQDQIDFGVLRLNSDNPFDRHKRNAG